MQQFRTQDDKSIMKNDFERRENSTGNAEIWTSMQGLSRVWNWEVGL
ncbi:MAG: hypothetical protein H6651_04615 [Ardenticatenales bacterium]|nr:hypothetical protein [Ardenticatenales bacterium]